MKRTFLLVLLLAGGAYAQVLPSPRPARAGDKPLPCDPISLMRRPPDFRPPTRIPVMEDRYLSLQMTMAGQERTHVPLVADDGGKLIPAGCGDSPGIFYVVPQLSRIFHLSLPDTLDVFLIGTVAAAVLIGVVGLSVLFRGGAMSYAAIPVLLLLGGLALHYGDLYPIAPSAAMAVIPWALVTVERGYSRNLLCASALFIGIAAGLANFIRDQAGTGMLLFAGILLAFVARSSRRTRTIALVAMLIGALVPGVTGHFLLNRRDAYLEKVQPGYVRGVRNHVLWHTVYLGFGFVQNDVVPGYKDEVAVDKVRSALPNVIYTSAEYDSYLRMAVVDLLRQHPLFGATTVFAKFGVLLMYFLLAANLGIIATIVEPKPPWIEIAWFVVLAFEALPGLVAVPRPTYILGYIATATLYGLVSLEYAYRRKRPVSQDIDSVLNSYPRQRPPLTKEHEACFVEEYRRNRDGRVGLHKHAMRLEGWMHRSIGSSGNGTYILELGAGNLNHVPYEPDAVVYDVVEPFHDLLESSAYKSRVRKVFDDIEDVPNDYTYDRIVSVAVLEHLTNLPAIVAQSALLLNENGQFQAGIPSEGGFLWGLAWRTTTGIAYRLRTKLNYATVIRHEHINNADEIAAVLRYFFRRVVIRRFPMGWKHLSFYTILEATEPRIELCRAHAKRTRGAVA